MKQLRFLVYVVPPVAVGCLLFGMYMVRPPASASTITKNDTAPPAPAPAKPAASNPVKAEVPPKPPAATPPAVVSSADAPVIVFDEKEFDFGTVFAGEKVEHHYTFKNTGKSTLTISNVKGSCGCTVAVASKNSIEPGEAGDIKATFDSTGRPGQNEKTITVTTNDPKSPQLTLKLKGLVREEWWSDPIQVQLGQLRRGQKIPDHTIKILSMKSRPVEVLEIEPSKPEIKVSQKPIETETDKGVEINVSFPDWKAWINPSKPNYLAEWINVKTSSTKVPSKRIMLYGQILEDILCEPKFLSFQAIKQGEETEKSIFINGSPDVTFHVTKVEKTFGGIETSLKTLDEGKKYELSVKVLKDAPIGRFRDTLKISTDYADQDSVTIYAYGAVKDPKEPDAPANNPAKLSVKEFHECIAGQTTDKQVLAKYGEPKNRAAVAGTGGTTFQYLNGTHADLAAFESVEFEFDPAGLLKEVRLSYKK